MCIRDRLSMFGARQVILRAVEHEPFERPTEDTVCTIAEQVRSTVEHIGPHADLLASLAGKENGVSGHRLLLHSDSMYRPRQCPRGFNRSFNVRAVPSNARTPEPRRVLPAVSYTHLT